MWIGSFKVSVTWTAVPGVTAYVVQRSTDAKTFADVAANPDAGVAAGKTYFYRVLTVNGDVRSNASNIDIATTIAFNDDPLSAGRTRISVTHVTQMRTAIDAVRAAAGLQAASWTQPAAFSAAQIVEMRNRLNEALDVLTALDGSLARPLYADSVLASRMSILAVHLQQLRDRVK